MISTTPPKNAVLPYDKLNSDWQPNITIFEGGFHCINTSRYSKDFHSEVRMHTAHPVYTYHRPDTFGEDPEFPSFVNCSTLANPEDIPIQHQTDYCEGGTSLI